MSALLGVSGVTTAPSGRAPVTSEWTDEYVGAGRRRREGVRNTSVESTPTIEIDRVTKRFGDYVAV